MICSIIRKRKSSNGIAIFVSPKKEDSIVSFYSMNVTPFLT